MNNYAKQSLRFFLQQIASNKWLFSTLVLFRVLALGIELSFPVFYKEVFDAISEVDNLDKAAAVPNLIDIFLIVCVLGFSLNVFNAFGNFLRARFQPLILRNISNYCFNRINQHSYEFFTRNFSGGLTIKVHRLMGSFASFSDRIYLDFIPLALRIIVIISVIGWYSTLLATVIFAWCLLFISVSLLFARWKYSIEVDKVRLETELHSNIVDVIGNNTNVKLFSALAFEQNRYEEGSHRWYRKFRYALNLSSAFDAFQQASIFVLEIVCLYIFIRLWQTGVFTGGFFFLMQVYLIGLFAVIFNFSMTLQSFFHAFADAEEMIEVLETPHAVNDMDNASDLLISQQPAIEFKDVSFTYNGKKNVLDNFNLAIKPGESVALVGQSGGGKTTIIRLIMRFFDVQKGEILLDGVNVAQVTQDSLRGNISLVPQEPSLFHRSIGDNIRYGKRNASDEEVIAAAKLAKCHEFITATLDGYDTLVGERGVKLSGGERQRIAIARAILEDAPLVIFDEATSNLDSKTEQLIQEAMTNLLSEKTGIVIAHRLATINKCDRIFVIENGRVKEQGSHNQLLQTEQSSYRDLWKIQAGAFVD